MSWCLRTRLAPLWVLTRLSPQFSTKLEVDVMDEFTSQLIQKKIEKWDHQKRRNESLLETSLKLEPKSGPFNMHRSTSGQIRALFQPSLDNDNTEEIISLTKSCVECGKTPPADALFTVLSACAQHGETDTIRRLQDLNENQDFRDFVAEAVWIKGDVVKALDLFEEVYRENAYLRRRIRLMLKHLMADLVAKGNGAAMDNAIAFSERILRDFQDFFPMACVWQNCFLSEWFADQKIALELIEKHSGLCRAVTNRIPYVVFVSLKCHRTEVVYRLLEVLLKYRMKGQYSSVLAPLLEYQFRYGDWISCNEIINWAVTNDVPLPQNHVIEKINLILNQKLNTPLAPTERRPPSKPDFKF